MIDHFWSNLLIDSTSGVFINDITDHYPIFTIIQLPIYTKPLKKHIEFRNFSENNKEKFSNSLNNTIWRNFISNVDINISINNFLDKLQSLFNSSFPLLTPS